MAVISQIAIIGAGPYGLSIAAHLKARGLNFRIFGRPMETWRTQMPAGMFLKSEGFASSLAAPQHSFTLAHYCKANGIPYRDVGLPVALETFWRYGLAFQRRFLPELEETVVTKVERSGAGFRLSLQDGVEVAATQVVVAAGLSHFAYLPPELAAVPEPLLTHSSRHAGFDGFAGKEVTVLGGGASAVDCAVLLRKAGASVTLVTRRPELLFHTPPGPRSLIDRIRAPMSGLGPGWRSRLCTDLPLVFHAMPESFRLAVVRRHLGPAPCWWTKDEIVGKVPIHLGMTMRRTTSEGERVALDLTDPSGKAISLSADRVIAATGFKVDLRRLAFLDPSLLAGIRSVEQTPILSTRFESSVPGLYFVGVASANSFGPMMRFAYGTNYTAGRLARHLARVRRPAQEAPVFAGGRAGLSGSDA
jgi:thioredoxin reductase